MAYENGGELVLTAEETASLVHNMLHPNVEACMRRDEFLRDLSTCGCRIEPGHTQCEDCGRTIEWDK